MSNQVINSFYAYQEAMRRISDNKESGEVSESLFSLEEEMENDISKLVDAVSNAEDNLKDVLSVSDSYQEILKMIM